MGGATSVDGSAETAQISQAADGSDVEIVDGDVALPGDRWTAGTLVYTRRSLARLFGWLLWGDFAWNMKERAVNPIALLMLNSFATPVWMVGLLVGSVPTAMGLILSPVASVKSDRHRGRWGRRIPFILVPTPFIVAFLVGLAFTPQIANWARSLLRSGAPSQAHLQIIVFALFWTALEIATIIANSIVNALFNDVVPHPLIGRFFGLFRVVGLLAGIIFNHYLVRLADTHFCALLTGIALLYGAGFLLMCLNVKEGQYPPPPPSELDRGRMLALIGYLKECFSEPYYICFFAATTLGNLTLAPVNTFAVLHAHSLGMSTASYGNCVALSYALSIVLAYPLGILADRFHPVRLALVFTSVYAIVTGIGFFFAVTSASFFVVLLLHTVISGCYLTATASIAQRMLPRARFGQLSSAGGIVGSICFVMLPPGLGLFIQYMNHDYRYVFLLASCLSAATVIAYLVLLSYLRPQTLKANASLALESKEEC